MCVYEIAFILDEINQHAHGDIQCHPNTLETNLLAITNLIIFIDDMHCCGCVYCLKFQIRSLGTEVSSHLSVKTFIRVSIFFPPLGNMFEGVE